MRALIFRPGASAELEEVDGFEGIRATVGGCVERIQLETDVFLYLDEDGLARRLKPNLWAEGPLYRGAPVVGVAVLVHEHGLPDGESRFRDVTESHVERYRRLRRLKERLGK